MKEVFDIKISIAPGIKTDQLAQGDTVKAICKITPNQPIRISSITGTLVLHKKGLLPEFKKTLDQFLLLSVEKELKTGKTYEFPFEFVKTTSIESYIGRNVSFNFGIHLSIYLHEDDYDNIKKGLLAKAEALFNKDNSIKHIAYLELRDKNKDYKLTDFNTSMRSKFYFEDKLVLGIILFCLYVLIGYFIFSALDQSPSEHSLIFSIICSLFLFALSYRPLFAQLRKIISMQIEMSLKQKDDELLHFRFEHPKSLKASRNPVRLFYEIIEEVIDSRGTTTAVYQEPIYRSKKYNVDTRAPKQSYTFPFPKNKHLSSLNTLNAYIIWEMVLETKTKWGFRIQYRGKFKVIKEA